MLKINLLNILSEPQPNKCHQLNTLLESSSIKDLFSYIEYIINFIFGNSQFKSTINMHIDGFSDANKKLQNTNSSLYLSNWPLKIINRTQHALDYDCMFSFLCTNSIFWSSLFKLDAYGAVFRLPISSFPSFIKTRITENSSSYLFNKIDDAHHYLNLTPIEYYFVFFFMFVHDNQTQSRKVYNEQNDCIELDSVYGDLLIDYLSFFLPLNKKNIDFSSSTNNQSNSYKLCFQNSNPPSHQSHHHNECQPSSSSSSSPSSPSSSCHKHTHLSEYPCLFKRSFKKVSLAQFENEFGKLDSSTKSEYNASSLERTNDIKKIDTFLRLINEILVYPFTLSQESTNQHHQSHLINSNNQSPAKRNNKSFEMNHQNNNTNNLLSNVQLLSPIKYNDTMQNLTSLENVFTLSMIIKHSHCFSNAFQAENPFLLRNNDNDNESNISKNLATTSSSTTTSQNSTSTSLAELRHYIFKIYWRKSLFKFFQYNLENWPFDSSIKWLIEFWLIYIQQQQQQQQYQRQNSNLYIKQNDAFDSLAKQQDFCRDNYFIYSDIYEILIKRYSIVDLTNLDNLQLVYKVLAVFVEYKDVIIKCDLKLSQIQTQWFQNFANSSNKINKQEYQHFMRHNTDFRYVINLFQEFDRPINTFRPLISVHNLKTVSHFYESLTCAKTILNEHLKRKNKVSNLSWFKSLFMPNEDGNGGQITKMNEQDLNKVIVSIDQCLELIKLFYENKASFEESDLFLSRNQQEEVSIEQQVPNSCENLQSSSDYTNNKEYKLSEKDRYKIINGLKKPKIVQTYDPETAPIGDFENKFLVYLARFVSDLINENYSQTIENVYYKEGAIGRLSKKIFYMPQRAGSKPKIELRSIASYKFIFYFLVYLLLLNILTGYSLLILIPFVFLLFFFNFILKN